MNEDLYIQLLYKRLQGEINPEEQGQLDQWLKASADHRFTAQTIEKAWELGEGEEPELNIDLDADFALLEERILADEEAEKTEAIVRPIGRKTPYWQIAAAIAALLVFAFLTRNYLTSSEQWNTLATVANASLEQQLADGSRVWLNENSQLEYPSEFAGGERRIRLNGEAFFEVTKDASKPFIIETGSGEVKVLGTSFSVRDHAKETTLEVAVVTGKVQLKGKTSEKVIVMTAGQSGLLDKQKKVLTKQLQSNNAAAWHTRELAFNEIPMREAIQDLEAFYDIQIKVENEALLNCPFTSTFKNQTIEAVMETLDTIFQTESEKLQDKIYNLRGGRSCN